jgi:hypothetical protein
MAYPQHRSAIDELNQGMIDGTYRQVNKDRGGVVEGATYAARRNLADVWYGIHEAAVKELPDALPAHTPTFVATPPAHLD